MATIEPKKIVTIAESVPTQYGQFLVGADPEYVNVGPHGVEDPRRIGSIGTDGACQEARPSPGKSGSELHQHLRRLLATGVKQSPPTWDWRAAPYIRQYPCGAHVHVGSSYRPRMEWEPICHTLDRTMGPVVEAYEGESGRLRRELSGYGRPGNMRTQDYGFEWRFPGSWLADPTVMTGVCGMALAIYKVLVVAFHGHPQAQQLVRDVRTRHFQTDSGKPFRAWMDAPVTALLAEAELLMPTRDQAAWQHVLKMADSGATVDYMVDIRDAWRFRDFRHRSIHRLASGVTAEQAMAAIAKEPVGSVPDSHNHAGILYYSSDQRLRQTARLAAALGTKSKARRRNVFVYVLNHKRGPSCWVSPNVLADAKKFLAEAGGSLKIVEGAYPGEQRSENTGRPYIGLSQEALNEHMDAAARLIAAVGVVDMNPQHVEFVGLQEEALSNTQPDDAMEVHGDCDCEFCRTNREGGI